MYDKKANSDIVKDPKYPDPKKMGKGKSYRVITTVIIIAIAFGLIYAATMLGPIECGC